MSLAGTFRLKPRDDRGQPLPECELMLSSVVSVDTEGKTLHGYGGDYCVYGIRTPAGTLWVKADVKDALLQSLGDRD